MLLIVISASAKAAAQHLKKLNNYCSLQKQICPASEINYGTAVIADSFMVIV
jgi:hypothetical protein